MREGADRGGAGRDCGAARPRVALAGGRGPARAPRSHRGCRAPGCRLAEAASRRRARFRVARGSPRAPGRGPGGGGSGARGPRGLRAGSPPRRGADARAGIPARARRPATARPRAARRGLEPPRSRRRPVGGGGGRPGRRGNRGAGPGRELLPALSPRSRSGRGLLERRRPGARRARPTGAEGRGARLPRALLVRTRAQARGVRPALLVRDARRRWRSLCGGPSPAGRSRPHPARGKVLSRRRSKRAWAIRSSPAGRTASPPGSRPVRLAPLWVSDLVRRDDAEGLYAFLEPRWSSLFAQVHSTATIVRETPRLDWASWLDDKAAIALWARAASTRAGRRTELATVFSDRRRWNRFWALAARDQWDRLPLVALLPDDARTAWFSLWQSPSPRDADPMLRARGETLERVGVALGRLVAGAPASEADPVVVKLRGPRAIGDILGNDARWCWPESGTGERRTRSGASGRDRRGTSWKRSFASAKATRRRRWFRSNRRDAEAKVRGRDWPRRSPKRSATKDLALSFAPDFARRLRLLLSQAGRNAAKPRHSCSRKSGASRQRLSENGFRVLSRIASDLDLGRSRGAPRSPDTRGRTLARLPLRQPRRGRCTAPHSEGRGRLPLRPRGPLAVDGSGPCRRTRCDSPFSSSGCRAPCRSPFAACAQLGGVWPGAAPWLERLRPEDRAAGLEALSLLPDATKLEVLLDREPKPEDDVVRLLRLRVALLRGDDTRALSLLDEALRDLDRRGLAYAPAPLPEPADEETAEVEAPVPMGDAAIARLHALLVPFREARRTELAAGRLREALRPRLEPGPATAEAWALALELAAPGDERAARLVELERVFLRGDLRPDALPVIVDAVARFAPAETPRWLARLPPDFDVRRGGRPGPGAPAKRRSRRRGPRARPVPGGAHSGLAPRTCAHSTSGARWRRRQMQGTSRRRDGRRPALSGGWARATWGPTSLPTCVPIPSTCVRRGRPCAPRARPRRTSTRLAAAALRESARLAGGESFGDETILRLRAAGAGCPGRWSPRGRRSRRLTRGGFRTSCSGAASRPRRSAARSRTWCASTAKAAGPPGPLSPRSKTSTRARLAHSGPSARSLRSALSSTGWQTGKRCRGVRATWIGPSSRELVARPAAEAGEGIGPTSRARAWHSSVPVSAPPVTAAEAPLPLPPAPVRLVIPDVPAFDLALTGVVPPRPRRTAGGGRPARRHLATHAGRQQARSAMGGALAGPALELVADPPPETALPRSRPSRSRRARGRSRSRHRARGAAVDPAGRDREEPRRRGDERGRAGSGRRPSGRPPPGPGLGPPRPAPAHRHERAGAPARPGRGLAGRGVMSFLPGLASLELDTDALAKDRYFRREFLFGESAMGRVRAALRQEGGRLLEVREGAGTPAGPRSSSRPRMRSAAGWETDGSRLFPGAPVGPPGDDPESVGTAGASARRPARDARRDGRPLPRGPPETGAGTEPRWEEGELALLRTLVIAALRAGAGASRSRRAASGLYVFAWPAPPSRTTWSARRRKPGATRRAHHGDHGGRHPGDTPGPGPRRPRAAASRRLRVDRLVGARARGGWRAPGRGSRRAVGAGRPARGPRRSRSLGARGGTGRAGAGPSLLRPRARPAGLDARRRERSRSSGVVRDKGWSERVVFERE